MTQKPQTSISQRIFSLALTVLLVCQFIYVPSLTAFAADGDVRNITYNFIHKPLGYQDEFRIKDSNGNFADFPRNYNNSFNTNLSGSVKVGEVTIAWAASDATRCYVSRTYSGQRSFIVEKDGNKSPYPSIKWMFTSDNDNISYVRVGNYYSGFNTGKTAEVTVKYSSYTNYTSLCLYFQELQLVLTKGDTIDLGSAGATISNLPSEVTYDGGGNPYYPHTPDFTLTCGGKTLTKDVDYSVSYQRNYQVGTATVTATGKGVLEGSLYTGSVSKTFRIVKANPRLTPPEGKELAYNEQAQELVTAGSTTYGCSLRYSLDGTNFSYKIPTATEEGEYTVYYFVSGNSNYNSTAVQSVKSTITKPTFTVSFDSTGGSSVSSEQVVYGNTVSEPTTAPTKDHGVFRGWYTADGTAYDFTAPVKSDLTLYAAWDDVRYVTFNYGNGTANRRETVLTGNTVGKPEDPAWQGFAFRGWYTSDGEYDFTSAVNDDVVLTAKWAASYIDENGREQWLEPDEYTAAAYGSNQWVTSNSTRWFVVTGNDTVYNYVMVRGNIRLVLADGLTLRVMKGIEVPDSSSLTVYAQSEGTGRLVTTGGTIYYQSGVPATYSGIGGSWNGNDSSQNNGHCGTINVYGGNIEATGCDDVPASNLAQFYYTPAIGGSVTGTVNIYGGSVKAYGAYGETGLGGFGTHVNIYGGTVEAYGGKDRSSTPNYNGKGIEGGYVHLYGGNVTGIGCVGIEGSTLTLSWTKESDSITASSFACHEDGDHSSLSLSKYFYLENTKEEAYWNNSGSNNLNGENNVTLVPAGALTVTFDPANGGETGNVTVPYGDTVSQPSAPSLAGYTFAGWTLDGAAYDFDAAVKSDITLTAQWNAAFLDSDGSVVNQPKDDAVILNGADSDTLLNWSNGWYFVENDLTISDRVTVSGDVRLVLFDGATLTAEKGITVEKTTTEEDGETFVKEGSLTVYAQSAGEHMGRLVANTSDKNAAIGSTNGNAGGTVTIISGSVTATGDYYSAGIGGGYHGAGGTVNISGGSVTAISGEDGSAGLGAGIGGGYYGAGGTVNITGGSVTATGGGNGGAGIGGGYYGAGGTVNITGGNVTATGGGSASGIGGGDISKCGGIISITGGNVTATGGSENGTGIGNGSFGSDGSITLDWTNESDSITASSYRGNITLAGEFVLSGTTTRATVSNIGGQTIVPSSALTVAFDTDGGSEVEDQTVMKGGKVTRPEDPTKEGYIFGGWLTDSGEVYDFDTPVTDFFGLTARWISTATYLDTDGTVQQPSDVTEITSDSVVLGQSDAEKWYAVDGSVTVTDRVVVQGNVKLILRDNSVLTAAKGITVPEGSSLTVYAQSTGENMGQLIADARPMDNMGLGYFYSAGIGGSIDPDFVLTNDTGDIIINGGSITAYGSKGAAGIGGGTGGAGSVTVNGGVVNATGGNDSQNYGAAGIGGGAGRAAGAIVINGGTVTANGGNGAADIGCGWGKAGGSVTINGGNVTAKGTSSSYGIGAGSNGYGSIPITLSWCKDSNTRIDCKYYNSSDVTLDREYIFQFEDDESTAVTTDNINGKVIIPKEYIEAPPVEYTVTIFLTDSSRYNGEEVSRQTVTEGECAICPAAPEREGYTFRFWGYWSPETEFDFSTPITGDLYLYGYWDQVGGNEDPSSGSDSSGEEEHYYNIIYDENGSNVEGMMFWQWVYFDEESPCLDENEYTREGYVFTGWNTEPDGSGVAYEDGASIAEPLCSNDYEQITLYAQWEKIRYSVTIDAGEGCNVSVLAGYTEEDGGTSVQSGDTVEEGTVLTVTATAKTGYHLTETPESSYTVTGNLTVTARAEKNTYAVTVTHDNGAELRFAGTDSLDAVPYGTQIVLTPGAPADGYEFIGWYQSNGKLIYYNELLPSYTVTVTSDMTLQARYRKVSGVVTFMSNSNTVKTGDIDDYAYPSDPTPYYGFEFTGWDKTQEEIGTALTAGETITVNAVFAPIQETITVTIYNGDSEEPTTATIHESGYYTVTAQEVAGKTFAYWTQDDSARSYRKKGSFYVTEDTTLRAVYTTDAVEAVGTANINQATYNPNTRKLSFVAYLTVPDGATITAAGLYAASGTSAKYTGGALTADNADYVKSSAKAVGTSGSVTYTWTKTSVSINDTWYARPYVTYSYNNSTETVYGDMVTVHAGCDYDSSEKATATIRSATYNSGTSKMSFVAYLTVPQDGIIVKAGLVAAPADSFDHPSATILTWDTAAYQKSSAKAVGTSGSVTYTWTKSSVNAGDTWYVRPYIIYTDSSSKEHTVYGELFSKTA